MSVVRRLYKSADRSEFIDETFDSITAAESNLNTFALEDSDDVVFWEYGYSILDEQGNIIKDVVYPVE